MSEADLGTGDPKCPLVLLLDTSYSMGVDRSPLPFAIDQLNNALVALRDAINEDSVAKRRVELMVVTFGGSVTPLGDFVVAQDWVPPMLAAAGDTPMGQAVATGIDLASQRRRELQRDGVPTYRPWIFLLTDGEPTDDVSAVPARVADTEKAKRAIFWSIAADGADLTVLKRFTPDKPILRLDERDWASLFRWVSAAVSKVSRSNPDDQITIDPWVLTA
jgi:uncharacterized protein YegL